MIILGVTGSIGSGKSFACKVLARLPGVEILSSDKIVHKIYSEDDNVISEISKSFPDAVKGGVIDRKILGDIVFKDTKKKKTLENIIYPRLGEYRKKFYQQCIKRRVKMLVLDVPLLFENNLQYECDYVLTVHCAPAIQRSRVLRRKGMTEQKLNDILRSQMPVHEKLKLSDFSINSGGSKAATVSRIEELFYTLNLK